MNKKTKRRKTSARAKAVFRFKGVLVALSCMVLVAVVSIGGTMAWLAAETEEITNTFTSSNVGVELDETPVDGGEYKMVPGNKIAKDPKVTVSEGSEDCWLFVEITKSDNYSTYLEDYKVASCWKLLSTAGANPAVYYYDNGTSTTASAGDSFYVLAGEGEGDLKTGYVQVKTSVTKEDFNFGTGKSKPTLTFKAYAVQKANMEDVEPAVAWTRAEKGGSDS